MTVVSTRLRPEHRDLLLSSAISPEVIEKSGIHSTPSGLVFPWSDGNGPVVNQFRPDNPEVDENGRPMKYLFRKGSRMVMSCLRDEGGSRVLVVEGTKQSYAALSHAPEDAAVYGLSGCWNWQDADLMRFKDRDVYVMFDGDVSTNRDVHTAADQFGTQLKRNGARSVLYVMTSARDKQGVDDVLAAMDQSKRRDMVAIWMRDATPKLPPAPRAKRKPKVDDADLSKLFHEDGGLKAKTAFEVLLDRSPAALTQEKAVAMYVDGRYEINGSAFLAAVTNMFGDVYTTGLKATLADMAEGTLYSKGLVLPESMDRPVLNCANGMLDLVTGELLPHDPSYLSSVQIPIEWNPDAKAPVYTEWLRASVAEGQMDDLEEVAGTMLDPSRTPSKAMFLFGPSRSGKSTFLRILRAVAGERNTSAVTLHDLSTDTFAAANVYGKMLNVAADLSSEHVRDLSRFKMMTGDDKVRGNRKYGKDFSFTNQSLFAFSANELPTVSESSKAYVERIKPFSFPNSFAGREDHSIERRLMNELEGILVRWVKAYQGFLQRGFYQKTELSVLSEFEAKSDRVAQFVQDMCIIHPAGPGEQMDAGKSAKRRDVVAAFNQWAKRNNGSELGEKKIFERLRNVAGLHDVRGPNRTRAFNVTLLSEEASERFPGEGGEEIPEAPSETGWGAPEAQSPQPSPAAAVEAVQSLAEPLAPVAETGGFEAEWLKRFEKDMNL